jgi:hypothetical protein
MKSRALIDLAEDFDRSPAEPPKPDRSSSVGKWKTQSGNLAHSAIGQSAVRFLAFEKIWVHEPWPSR